MERNHNGGFTLLETLLTVAILVILLGVSAVGVAYHRDYLKITELDNAARDIYMAAENRAVLLQNSGQLRTSATPLSGGSSPSLILTLSGSGSPVTIDTLSSSGNIDELADLLPAGTIDPALWSGDFRVVYDQATGHVKEVFYAKEAFSEDLDNFRKSRGDRVTEFRKGDTSRLVGWYSSGAAASIVTKPLPSPGVEILIDNGEELTLTVRYTLPEGLPATMEPPKPTKVKLFYPKNSETPIVEFPVSGLSFSGNTATYTTVLDSLESGKQFKDLKSGLTNLGGDFKVTAGLTLSAPGWVDSAYYADGTDNSLFAKGSTASTNPSDPDCTHTALIANLRHLQNLRAQNPTFTSKVGNSITKAIQIENIECSKYKEKEYNFVPIHNTSLTLYEGNDHEISNLHVAYNSNAGLFARIADSRDSEMTIQNLTMIAPSVSATGNAGAVVGRVGYLGSWVPATATIQNVSVINAAISAKNAGDNPGAGGVVGWVGGGRTCSISNCRVYWDDASQLTDESGEIVYKICGQNAGGLVGTVGNGGADLATCIIRNSHASTTVKAERSNNGYSGTAGGLIGLAYYVDRIEIDSSYADCYIKNTAGNAVWAASGGLVGSVPPKSTWSDAYVKVTNCYAAGFIDGTSVHPAGLFYGELPSSESEVTNCYSVVRVMKADGTLEKPATPMYSGWNESSPGSAFYLSKANEVAGAVETALGSAFEHDTDKPETHVYDLRHRLDNTVETLIGKNYPFPGLKNVTETVIKPDGTPETIPAHYGDWAELEGSSGAGLVYYETYGDDSYGVWGVDAAGVELQALRDDGVVKKDGYALLFEGTAPDGFTIKYGDTDDNTLTWTLQIASGGTKWVESSGQNDSPAIAQFQVAGGGKYTLVPLPYWIVTLAWKNISQYDNNFYRKLACGPDKATYWFNPHFAKTVVKQDDAPAEPTHSKKDAIIVRTIRHLWHLSTIRYTEGSINYQAYVHNKTYYFKQELDLDSTYGVGITGFAFPQDYRSIGYCDGTDRNIFKGTYDGQGKSIKGVGYGDGATIVSNYVGLFGRNDGTLKNIVYHMSKFIPNTSGTGTTYFGGLAACNNGTVEDCKVIVDTGKLESNSLSLGSTGICVGGLVGWNNTNGTIKDSRVIGGENPDDAAAVSLSAMENQISMSAKNPSHSYLHVGGLVGYNKGGTISLPGDVSVKVGTLTNSGYSACVGGLAGAFKGDAIENCKAEVGVLTSSGTYAKVGGLVGLNENSVIRNCTIGAPKLDIKAVGAKVGGLVGYNKGTIQEGLDAAAGEAGTVTENIWAIQLEEVSVPALSLGSGTGVGGLVGRNEGTVTGKPKGDSVYSITVGTVSEAASSASVGSLIGENDGTVTDCKAKVKHLVGNSGSVGGLVGFNTNTVTDCAADVNSLKKAGAFSSYVGGLVGQNSEAVTRCTAKVNNLTSSGGQRGSVGGLVGINNSNTASITDCTATVVDLVNERYGGAAVGGLVGTNGRSTQNDERSVLMNCTAEVGSLINSGNEAYVAGLAGGGYGKIWNCQVTVGPLTNSGEKASVAGLTGYVGKMPALSYLEYVGDIGGCTAEVGPLSNSGYRANVGGLVGYTTIGIHAYTDEKTSEEICSSVKVATLTNSGEKANVGGLVGYSSCDGGVSSDGVKRIIVDCAAEVGTLNNQGKSANVGGLVGWNYNNHRSGSGGTVTDCPATIKNCTATVEELLNTGNSGYYNPWNSNNPAAGIGGLVGQNRAAGVEGCTATVTGALTNRGEYAKVGGLVGCNCSVQQNISPERWEQSEITDCTATVKGALTNEGRYANVGGLAGMNTGILQGTIGEDGTSTCRAKVDTLTNSGESAYVGGLVGYSYNLSYISNKYIPWPVAVTGCTASVDKTLTNSGRYANVGGLAGSSGSDSTVTNCAALVGDALTNSGASANVGGLAGSSGSDSTVESCTASVGNALTNSGYRAYVGGLVGQNQGGSTVRDCAAHMETLTNQRDGAYVGGLAGGNSGTIAAVEGEKCFAEVGTLTNATTDATEDACVGGLVGWNQSAIKGVRMGSESTCFAKVTKLETAGTAYVGGLVGENDSAVVEGCTATVTELLNKGNTGIAVGGLVGYNYDTLNREDHTAVIKNCAATVTTLTNSEDGKKARVGGLVGLNWGTIGGDKDDKDAGCFAEVETLTNEGASANVGGLAGYNQPFGVILECKTTTVTTLTNTKNGKKAYVGGLVGYNDGGRVEESGTEVDTLTNRGQYAYVGGLVGYNGINGASGQRRGLVKKCYTKVATLTNDINEGSSMMDQNSGARVGGLVGDNCSGQVESCTAAITGGADRAIALVNRSGGAHVGGLVGHNEKNSASRGAPTATISSCVASVAGISNEEGYLSYVGGLVGYNGSSATIREGVATVSLTLENKKEGYVGGLVGVNHEFSSSIEQSRAIVAVFTDQKIGSLIGSNNSWSVTNCTANRDPMVGSGSIDSSNQVDSNLSLTGYNGGADAVAAALPPEQPEGVKGRRKKSRRETD